MILTRPELKDLRKVTVKIICQPNNNEGSGTIVLIGEKFYVLTAAHVIEAEKNKKEPLAVDDIKVALYRNSNVFGFKSKKLILYNPDKDVAVIEVENTDDAPVSGLDKVRLLAKEIDGDATLCGFRYKEETLRINKVERRESDIWAVNIELASQPINAQNNFAGTSGGGVFYSDSSDGLLYMSAYMTGIHTRRGTNNEIDCPTALAFAECEPIRQLIDESDFKYVGDTGMADFIDSKLKLKPLTKSLFPETLKNDLLENETTVMILNALRDDDEPTLCLAALSGMGKTKLIYEAFRHSERMTNRYYTKYAGNEDDIIGEATQIMRNAAKEDEDGLIVIDDCPIEFLPEVVARRNQYNSQFRIIATTHDYFDERLKKHMEAKVLWLSPKDMEDRVNEYIDEELPANKYPENDVKDIKDLAGGYPQMALELVAAYKKENEAGVDIVEHLMPKLLNLDEKRDANELTVMQTLSLCMPCPYDGNPRVAFEYLIGQDLITPLGPMSFSQRRSLAERLIKQYQPTLVDVIRDWLYVRPFPLAVWLTARWFNNVCNCSDHFKEMIQSIQEQDVNIQKFISEGFCKHIQQMHGNMAAFEMVGELVRRDVSDPFFNEEVLCSGLGSRLFLAMTTVNPASVADCLYDIFNGKSIEWLRTNFNGDGRRNIVWGLEKLCFAKESFEKGVLALARLAVAENEDIGNNATAQLKQLFHIQLAGTEVDLVTRLDMLKEMSVAGKEYQNITISCIGEALRNGGFTKMGGAEKFGFENKKDYSPKTYEELFKYWYGCRDLLLDWLDRDPGIVEAVGRIVEDNTFQWVRSRNFNVLKPLIEKVSTLKDGKWESEYEQLEEVGRVYKEDELDDISAKILKEWTLRLRPSTFITDLKEARHRLWAEYRLKDKDLIGLAAKLYDPLVERFVKEKIYVNENEVRLIYYDKDYVDFRFTSKISEVLNHEQMESLLGVVLKIVLETDDNFYSPFLFNLCSEAKSRPELQMFLDGIYNNDRLNLYLKVLASSEDDELHNFYRVDKEMKAGKLPGNAMVGYLSNYRANYKDRYEKMVMAIHQTYPDNYGLLVDYVLIHRIFMDNDDDVDCKSVIRNAIIHYPVNDENDQNFYEYARLVIHILEHAKDDKEFAKAINLKMIDLYNTKFVHLNSEGIFTELIRHYTDVVWEDFVDKFLSPDYYLFYYQVKNELGSGYGFGKGPLFEMGDDKLMALCVKYPDSAPTRIASMVPCFDYAEKEENAKPIDQFSTWFIWLLDNFGDRKDVRDSLHVNLGSYFWSGSTIPLHERNLRCFKNLYNHPRSEVVEWAQLCVKDEQAMLERERSNEDFIKIRYGM